MTYSLYGVTMTVTGILVVAASLGHVHSAMHGSADDACCANERRSPTAGGREHAENVEQYNTPIPLPRTKLEGTSYPASSFSLQLRCLSYLMCHILGLCN